MQEPRIDWPENTFWNMLFPSLYRKALRKALKKYHRDTDKYFTEQLAESLSISFEEANQLRHPPS